MDIEPLKHSAITEIIIRTFYEVYNKLGYGFLEKVYENAMLIQLEKNGLTIEQQKKIEVFFGDFLVGEYYADLIVENVIILELKAAKTLDPSHEAQLVNYLKASEMEIGLLLNFGPKATFKRKIFTNSIYSFSTEHNSISG